MSLPVTSDGHAAMSDTLHVLGCGNALASGGRQQSAYLLDMAGERLLIDCGATTLPVLVQAGIDTNSIPAILLSHLHGDHFGGVPFVLLHAMFAAGRTDPLVIIGPPGTEARCRTLCDVLYPGTFAQELPFALTFREITPGEVLRQGALAVTAHVMAHEAGAPCYGYRIAAGGKCLAYSGDSGWCDNIVAVGQAADLYVVECTFSTGHMPMHLSYAELQSALHAIAARRLLLVHLGDDMLARGDIDADILAYDGRIVAF